MDNVIIVNFVEKFDIIDKQWKIDWAEPFEPVELDVAVNVQIGHVADLINEVVAQHQIAEILKNQILNDDVAYQ